MEPLLSVVTITYNQEPFIRKCIEGVLMQKVNFPIEFIIADDCSIDGTLATCEEYARKYPDLIRIVTSDVNVGAVENEQRAFLAAKGKYIATCEGDDYWTDPLKLQKQVDFLESHPDYSVCFHRFKRVHLSDGSEDRDLCDNLFPDCASDGLEISMHQFMHQWVTQYLTMVFRRDAYDFDAYRRYKYFRDTHQVYHLLLNGRAWLFAFDGGVYRMTGEGIYSTKDAFDKERIVLAVDDELWKVNNSKEWKDNCMSVAQDILYHYKEWKYPVKYLFRYSFMLFFNGGTLSKLLRNLFRVIE